MKTVGPLVSLRVYPDSSSSRPARLSTVLPALSSGAPPAKMKTTNAWLALALAAVANCNSNYHAFKAPGPHDREDRRLPGTGVIANSRAQVEAPAPC